MQKGDTMRTRSGRRRRLLRNAVEGAGPRVPVWAGVESLESRTMLYSAPAVLPRQHPSRGEALAITKRVDVVHDRDGGVARPQEVGVQ